MYPVNRNTVLGAGYLYFDWWGTTGLPRGERYIANTENLEISVTPGGNVKDYDADGEIATLNLDIDTQVERMLTFTTKHISDDALSLFFGTNTAASSTETAGAKTGTTINGGNPVYKNRWYQLGEALYTGGVRQISSVTIKTTAQTPVVLDEETDGDVSSSNTDYILDATNGRIFLLANGTNVTSGTTCLTADFTTVSGSTKTTMSIKSATITRVRGSLRFISANTVGRERDFYVPDCFLSPNGPFALKSRENVQRLGFNARIQQPEEGTAIVWTFRQ